MSVPSMVHRSGDTLIVRSVVSGDELYPEDRQRILPRQPEKQPETQPEQPTAFIEKELPDLPDCKVRRNYSCSGCEYFTQNPRHYLYHLRDVHKEKVRIYECPNCLYASKHFQKLLRHSRMVHANKPDAAASNDVKQKPQPQRPVTAEDDDDDVDDANRNSSEPSDQEEPDPEPEATKTPSVFKCSVCSFTAKSQFFLGKHEKEEHIKTKFFRCSKCTYVTHMKARFTKHVKYHSMPMIKCDTCDFRTPYKWNLDRHCKNHNGKGAFRCSACNFTADIKQSLTVHEMNHHVPPVGQAAGFGIGRRRNKVGASDTAAAEEAALHLSVASQVPIVRTTDAAAASSVDVEKTTRSVNNNNNNKANNRTTSNVCVKKPKTTSKNLSDYNQAPSPFGSDFINPDDIVHHASGNVYFKNKCKLCNFKSAWDSEMTKHEARVHNIVKEVVATPLKPTSTTKKTHRPIPNLIPIHHNNNNNNNFKYQTEPIMSQKDFNEICAKSTNSALKDFASLMDGENIFETAAFVATPPPPPPPPAAPRVPDLIPASLVSVASPRKQLNAFKRKNASFFDKLKEKLMTGCHQDATNLTCQYCGHQSKCLTEQVKHQKLCCGTERSHVVNHPNVFTSSSRCQYCRQRCKSSVDLFNHLQTCLEAQKTLNTLAHQEDPGFKSEQVKLEPPSPLTIKTEPCEYDNKTHPMENRVFVWNNIEVPMDIDVDDSIYEYTDDKGSDMCINEDKLEDNVSLDLSIRTHSPNSSENSFADAEQQQQQQLQQHHQQQQQQQPHVPEKIPTHGTDISVAQHKRVFQCPHCTFWASTASRFHVHIVGHLNKKPFECSLCSYRSNWRWDITKHIKLKSVRDPAHESAKVLMTDETGRRNYTKYNKYLTEIHVSVDQSLDTSGGNGTRHRGTQSKTSTSEQTGVVGNKQPKMPPITADFNSVIKNTALKAAAAASSASPKHAANNDVLYTRVSDKKKSTNDTKRTLFKCKKCNFRDASREVLLQHVKGHYATATSSSSSNSNSMGLEMMNIGRSDVVEKDERHCRLKHGGDIRVVSNKNGLEKVEIEEQTDEPDHVDVVQTGTFKCKSCPFSNDNHTDFEAHLEGHVAKSDTIIKCHYCNYFVSRKEDLLEHLVLHGVSDPEDFLQRLSDRDDIGKRFRCLICPYDTNSKSQYTYHKQFHKPRGGQYSCTQCSYNVSKRHLLHQHLKVHGINITPHKQNGDTIDMDDIDEIEEVPSSISSCSNSSMDLQQFPDIPLVWVSKNGKFTKMYKCRYCPHVNLRKVNIQEHEKMHSIREKNPNSKGTTEIEHHCNECNYVCNNAGVLSSHSKVHQGLSGTVHCLVDPSKSDEEQITELSRIFNTPTLDLTTPLDEIETIDTIMDQSGDDDDSQLYFCNECPARFLKENEHTIHVRFHGVRLFYKCEYCSYTSREKRHLLVHNQIHSSEYQERTKTLLETYQMSLKHPQPQIFQVTPNRSEPVWIVLEKSGDSSSTDDNKSSSTKSKSVNVPLSGTDLFQQKFEAEQRAVEDNLKFKDPQFGVLMHGNPNFIYPTTVKNGRMKEKRYKCPKCPSAFEKREQYKIHLGLHGSKQRYKCEICDYSVKYYANYVQHKKKHTINDKALADKQAETENDEELEETYEEELEEEHLDQSCSTIKEHLIDEKRLFYCHLCPYANYRKDAVDNHLKRHVCISGITNMHTCQICDYSVPQVHFLKDHFKLHNVPVKIEETGDETQSRSESSDIPPPDRFNNNEGEKEYQSTEDDSVLLFSKIKTEN